MADILELTGEHAEYLRDESRSVGAAESISFPWQSPKSAQLYLLAT